MAYVYLSYAWRSETGKVRPNNEDAIAIVPAEGAFFVADGMGGGRDGELASAWTAEGITRALTHLRKPRPLPLAIGLKCDRIAAELARVSARLLEHAGADPNARKCGSTVAGIVFDAAAPGQATRLHAGDSRVYRWRKGALQVLTRDHNLGNSEGMSGMSLAPRFKAMLTRGVGLSEELKLERQCFDVRAGDILLVCSDGLSSYVKERRIAKLIAAGALAVEPDGRLAMKDVAGALVDAAIESGGKDNCTVCVVRVDHLPDPISEVLEDVDDGEPDDDAAKSEADTAQTASHLTDTPLDPVAVSPGSPAAVVDSAPVLKGQTAADQALASASGDVLNEEKKALAALAAVQNDLPEDCSDAVRLVPPQTDEPSGAGKEVGEKDAGAVREGTEASDTWRMGPRRGFKRHRLILALLCCASLAMGVMFWRMVAVEQGKVSSPVSSSAAPSAGDADNLSASAEAADTKVGQSETAANQDSGSLPVSPLAAVPPSEKTEASAVDSQASVPVLPGNGSAKPPVAHELSGRPSRTAAGSAVAEPAHGTVASGLNQTAAPTLPSADEPRTVVALRDGVWPVAIQASWRTSASAPWHPLKEEAKLPRDSLIEVKFVHDDFGVELGSVKTERENVVVSPPEGWLDACSWKWSGPVRDSLRAEWRVFGAKNWRALKPETRFLAERNYEFRFEDSDPAWQLATNRIAISLEKRSFVGLTPPPGWSRQASLRLAGDLPARTRLELKLDGQKDWLSVTNMSFALVTGPHYRYRLTRPDYERVEGDVGSVTGEAAVVQVPGKWRATPALLALGNMEQRWKVFSSRLSADEASALLDAAVELSAREKDLQEPEARGKAKAYLKAVQGYRDWVTALKDALGNLKRIMEAPPDRVSLERAMEVAEELAGQAGRGKDYPLDSRRTLELYTQSAVWLETLFYRYQTDFAKDPQYARLHKAINAFNAFRGAREGYDGVVQPVAHSAP